MSKFQELSFNKMVISAVQRWNRERKAAGDLPFSIGCNDQMAHEILNAPLEEKRPRISFASLLKKNELGGLLSKMSSGAKEISKAPGDLLDKIHSKAQFSKTAEETKSGLWIVRTVDPETNGFKTEVLTPAEFSDLQNGMKESDDILITIETKQDQVVVTQKIGGLLAARNEASVSVYKVQEDGNVETVQEAFYDKGVKFPRKDFIEKMKARAEENVVFGTAY